MWTAAIIAGGQARRLGGRDKAALRIGGTSILERQIAALHGLVGHIFIVANDPDRFRAAGVPVVPDLSPGSGALGGVYTAVSAATGDRTLVVACDLPFLTRGLLARLIEVGRAADIAVPHGASGLQPLCATYSRACLPELRRRVEAGQLRIADLIRHAGEAGARMPAARSGGSSEIAASDLHVVELRADELARLGDEEVMFFNVNTPADYARAEQLMTDRLRRDPARDR
jgi:molybdopterin-guanine dinucleotide biosynthesis protein A